MKTLDELRAALSDENVQAWLRCIRYGESHDSDARAYAALYGWNVAGEASAKVFNSYADHPQQYFDAGGGRKTSAAGAYQIVYTTWKNLRQRRPGAYPDFSQASQDLAAVDLTDGRGALDDVIAGRLLSAILKCRQEWTSLPGALESRHSVDEYRRVFVSWGGKLASDPQPDVAEEQPPAPVEERSTQYVPEQPMADQPSPFVAVGNAVAAAAGVANPIIPVVWNVLQNLLPALAPLAKNEKAKENIALAGAVVDSVTKAVGATNAQQAMEIVTNDPQARMKADSAVREQFATALGLVEVGGGVEGARAANTAAIDHADKWWKLVLNPVLMVTVLTLPLVYMITWRLIEHMDKVSSDVIAQTIGTVVGLVLGSVCGFWMGQTYTATQAKRASDSPAR